MILNRLTGADFNQYTGGTFNKSAGVNFSVSNLTFDGNGNILSMNQKGLKLNTGNVLNMLFLLTTRKSYNLKPIVATIFPALFLRKAGSFGLS